MQNFKTYITENKMIKSKDGMKAPSGFVVVKSRTKQKSDGERFVGYIPLSAEPVRGLKHSYYDGEWYYHVFKDHRV